MKGKLCLIPEILSFIFIALLCFISYGIHDEILEETFLEYYFDERDEVKVPVIMYHSILDSKAKTGKYVITPEELEKDLIYIKEKGFSTVTTSELIDFVYNDRRLPEKPIVLTFDDGYYNNYSYLYPMLKKHDMKAVISVIGKYSDISSNDNAKLNNNYSHLTWEEIKEMHKSGHIEILNHSYDMHSPQTRNGVKKKNNESDNEYLNSIKNDIHTMQMQINEQLSTSVPAFTYPFGFITDSSSRLLKDMGYLATYSCYEGISTINKSPESLYELRRYNRSGETDTTAFFHKILSMYSPDGLAKNDSPKTVIKK